MNEGSLLKRSLVVTGALLGISTVWVALVSVVLVTVVDRVVSPSSSSSTSATISPAPADAHRAGPTPPGAKPNG